MTLTDRTAHIDDMADTAAPAMSTNITALIHSTFSSVPFWRMRSASTAQPPLQHEPAMFTSRAADALGSFDPACTVSPRCGPPAAPEPSGIAAIACPIDPARRPRPPA